VLLGAAKANPFVNFAKNVGMITLKKVEEFFQMKMIFPSLLELIRDNVVVILVNGV
jgi:hypothetical protein